MLEDKIAIYEKKIHELENELEKFKTSITG
jgi:hypothetical protein